MVALRKKRLYVSGIGRKIGATGLEPATFDGFPFPMG
jgi:hypothetical protein